MSLDWLIIGGGIHGVHLAVRLLAEGGVDRDRVKILDPAARLLARWKSCSAATGMRYLRSPSVHHLDLSPRSLQRFAGKRKTRASILFAPPYDRPSLALFNAHCDHVLETHGIADLHLRDRALSCAVECDGVVVRTASGIDLSAQNVVLAVGSGDQLHWPAWAPRRHPRVQHVFAPGGDDPWRAEEPQHVAVVGGGISAAQVALRRMKEGHRVTLISRHAVRRHQFDSDPGWQGPRFMSRFRRERDPDRRRATITKARHAGSVPPDVWRALRRAIAHDRVTWKEAEIDELTVGSDDLHLRLSSEEKVHVDRMLLATGFAAERPGGRLVDDLVASASLPCAQCGFPITDTALRWHPRVFVTGPLAELELGPAARNISGARRAGDRLVQVL